MTVTSGSTEARAALKAIIDAEFAPEGWITLNDYLHQSLGAEGTRIGISPNRQRPLSGQSLVMTYEIFVQFYWKYKQEVDPTSKVDPITIETYAERFLRALEDASHTGTDRMWYFQLTDLVYPVDPTGNKTRFEATITAYGNNSTLMETVG